MADIKYIGKNIFNHDLIVRKGNISGSASSTGSFGHIIKGGVNWDTAVSSSAAAGGFGPTGQNTFTSVGISGSFTEASGGFSTRLTAAETELELTLLSGSAQVIALLPTGTVSQSAQIKTEISGAFTTTSSSLASRITSREAVTVGGGYKHTQSSVAANWAVTHSLNEKHPSVTVYDNNNQVVVPSSITANSISSSTIAFDFPISGYALYSIGGFQARPSDGAYVHTESSAGTSWTITHDLNTQYPTVTVYDSNDQVIIPASITATTISSSTITFDSPVSGKAAFSVGGNLSGSLTSTGSFGSLYIAGSGTSTFTSITATGNISSSITSTGSFGHIIKGGVNWDTAVSTSAAAGGFGPTGQNTFTSAGISGSWQSQNFSATQSFSDGTATKISGSSTSTGSFGFGHIAGKLRVETTASLSGNGSETLVVGSDAGGSRGITIFTANNTSGYLSFADAASGAGTYAGQIGYGHTDNQLMFSSAGSWRMRLDSNGLFPNSNNLIPLGKSGTAWADLFLADGAVINFNSNEVKLSHSGAQLVLSGSGTTQLFVEGDVSGSATSTGSFGHVLVDGFKHTNEVLKGIGSTSVTAGKLYYLKDVGNLGTSTWQFACAASASSAVSSGSDELLAVAMGSGSYWDDATSQTGVASSIGMLTRGVTAITSSFFAGTKVIGGAIYMATASAKEGQYQFTTPSADGDRVRIVGNCISTGSKDITVRFNPSTTYLVLSGSS